MAKAEASVEELVGMIERGELRLPEMQRRYVWRSTRVRDLLDSLYRGYPSWFAHGYGCCKSFARRTGGHGWWPLQSGPGILQSANRRLVRRVSSSQRLGRTSSA